MWNGPRPTSELSMRLCMQDECVICSRTSFAICFPATLVAGGLWLQTSSRLHRCKNVLASPRQQCLEHDELQSLPIDGTMKCFVAFARASKPIETEAHPSVLFLCRVITVCDRTNEVLALMPSQGSLLSWLQQAYQITSRKQHDDLHTMLQATCRQRR